MKQLENKTLDNKMEMDILDGLDEIRTLNAKVSKVDPLAVLEMKKEEWAAEDQEAEELILDEEEVLALEELETKIQIKDAVKRLEGDEEDEDFDPAHPFLFRPVAEKEEDPKHLDGEGFTLPKPVKVKKTNKPGHSSIISIQTGIPGKGVAIKFEPRYRREAIVHDEEEKKFHLKEIEKEIEEKIEKEKEERKMEVEQGPDVEMEGGFSLVNY